MIESLLRSQNRCLERLLAASEELLASPGVPDRALLDLLDSTRASALKAYGILDRKVAEQAEALRASGLAPARLAAIRAEVERKDFLLARVRQADEALMARLRAAQAEIERELASSRKAKKAVGSFKSSPARPGEGLDTQA